MRESQTAVLERGIRVEDEFATEPFEVAWAGEARWFVQFLEPGEDATVTLTPQVSADGLAWVDHEAPAVEVAAGGLITLPLRDFGHWLRLVVRRSGGRTAPLARIYLALKE
ncbi:hypothetical protein OG896_27895 [Streptomyces sp. NBC_00669]|uniref:hypothetical protein n=1 Tax=unclassified Streptomyces TaxID=2593676 RepID=UPI002E33A25D|nr:hypothetical protein [Streptomyces sp. NBC_00669]